MTNIKKNQVVAIVVTYHPDLDLLSAQLTRLVSQVSDIVLVDNGSSCDLGAWKNNLEYSTVSVIPLGDNRGIATAHNKGIEWARKQGADYVLLMDQDSLPAPNMVEKLIAAIKDKPLAAAAGPRYLDERQNNPPPFIRIRGLSLERCACSTAEAIVAVDYLISSGCLIPMAVLNKVGVMRDDFLLIMLI